MCEKILVLQGLLRYANVLNCKHALEQLVTSVLCLVSFLTVIFLFEQMMWWLEDCKLMITPFDLKGDDKIRFEE